MPHALESSFRGRRNGAARGAFKSRAGDVVDDFAELRRDMSRLADAGYKAARAEVEDAGHRLETIGRSMRSRARDGADYVGEQVRTHPAATIGISVGLGLLLGALFSLTARR